MGALMIMRRIVMHLLGPHRPNDANIVGHTADPGGEIGNLQPVLAVLLELLLFVSLHSNRSPDREGGVAPEMERIKRSEY